MDVIITPSPLRGSVTPPPSKSLSHRLLLANLLSDEPKSIANLAQSEDIDATARCARALKEADGAAPFLDCGESGSTLRFMIPIALALRGGGIFTGHGRLMERPQKPYFDIFDECGVSYEKSGSVLTVRGELTPGEFRLPGDVSSQFVTGLLYALPRLDGDSEIVLTSPLESRSYVDMTVSVLRRFGIRLENRSYESFYVPGRQSYVSVDTAVEADWSQAGFWYAARFLGNEVEILGLDAHSAQGDRVIARLFDEMSGDGDIKIDVSDCPDLLPPLSVMAALRRGATEFTNAARLRIKESDRLSAVREVLGTLGADISERPDGLTVHGTDKLTGGEIDAPNDHRIAMMAAVAATVCENPVTVHGAECVRKSYPSFWREYERLGGRIEVPK